MKSIHSPIRHDVYVSVLRSIGRQAVSTDVERDVEVTVYFPVLDQIGIVEISLQRLLRFSLQRKLNPS